MDGRGGGHRRSEAAARRGGAGGARVRWSRESGCQLRAGNSTGSRASGGLARRVVARGRQEGVSLARGPDAARIGPSTLGGWHRTSSFRRGPARPAGAPALPVSRGGADTRDRVAGALEPGPGRARRADRSGRKAGVTAAWVRPAHGPIDLNRATTGAGSARGSGQRSPRIVAYRDSAVGSGTPEQPRVAESAPPWNGCGPRVRSTSDLASVGSNIHPLRSFHSQGCSTGSMVSTTVPTDRIGELLVREG